MMQLQDHNHLWRDMWLRIMCLKLKHSGHWNLLQVTIHLTRPRTLLNFFQQCSLTVKLLGICLWRAKSSILLCIWSGWTLQKAAPRQCQWTFCCIVSWKPKHKIQEKQMDVHVRFWNHQTNQVTRRYFNSEFLGECWVFYYGLAIALFLLLPFVLMFKCLWRSWWQILLFTVN